MNAPDSFVARLASVFDNRLRIRWSDREGCFHIEQRVGRATIAPVFIDSTRDDLIRARDGFHPIMTVQPGDRMPCPECHYQLHVPVMDTWDMRCPYCETKGRSTRVVAGYWPLNDLLIEHLRKIDPLRGASTELAEEADRHNRLLLKAQEDEAFAPGFDAFDSNYNNLVGIPQTGYTGKILPGSQLGDKDIAA